MSRRIVAVVGVLLLAVAVYVGAQPLDSGDNFCGNAFVSRGHNHQFNGCDGRLTARRLGVGVVAVAGVGCLVIAAQRRERA